MLFQFSEKKKKKNSNNTAVPVQLQKTRGVTTGLFPFYATYTFTPVQLFCSFSYELLFADYNYYKNISN